MKVFQRNLLKIMIAFGAIFLIYLSSLATLLMGKDSISKKCNYASWAHLQVEKSGFDTRKEAGSSYEPGPYHERTGEKKKGLLSFEEKDHLSKGTQPPILTSIEPYKDLPAHYILLIDQSGTIARIQGYKEEVATLLSKRIPHLIMKPDENGIALPAYQPGKDYLSVIFFGIPKSTPNFDKLLHPAAIFWCENEQFNTLGQQVSQRSFDYNFSAISVALPLSLPLIKKSLSSPETLANLNLSSADLRFSRTVGIILTDNMYNVEASCLDELTYLSRFGQVEGMYEARKMIQEVRRYYDYDLNFWTFFNEGSTKKFLIAIREFVPKTIALTSLLAKTSDITLDRFAPTSHELYYTGEIKLDFFSPDQSPFCYYQPHELRWKLMNESGYHIIPLKDFKEKDLRTTYLPPLQVKFKKPVSEDLYEDSNNYSAKIHLSYDFIDPCYGFNVVTFPSQVYMHPHPIEMLPLPWKSLLTDKCLMDYAPRSPKEIQEIYRGRLRWSLGILLVIGGILVYFLFRPSSKVDIQDVSTENEPVIIDFNSRAGEHTMIVKTFQVISTAGKRFFFIPPLWPCRVPLRLEIQEERSKNSPASAISRKGTLIGMTHDVNLTIEKEQYTPGQQVFVFCRPKTIKDFKGQGQEAELTYTITAYQLKRRLIFWSTWLELPTTLNDKVKFKFWPEKAYPVSKLEIHPPYEREGIEHRKGECPLIGDLTVESSAKHYCSEPVECTYALLSWKKGENLGEENRYATFDPSSYKIFRDRSQASETFVQIPNLGYQQETDDEFTRRLTQVKIANLGYKQEAYIEFKADFNQIINPKIGPDEYNLHVSLVDPPTEDKLLSGVYHD